MRKINILILLLSLLCVTMIFQVLVFVRLFWLVVSIIS